MWLSLLVLSSAYQLQFRSGNQHAVAVGSEYGDVNVVLILDYAEIERSQVETLMTFSYELYKNFAKHGLVLWMQSLMMDDVNLVSEIPVNSSNSVEFAKRLESSYDQRYKSSSRSTLRWYAGALRKTMELLDTGSKSMKVAILITHGKEQCPQDHHPCHICCQHCRQCNPCKHNFNGVEIDYVVSDQVETLARKSIMIIPIGVGQKIDPDRLLCWATMTRGNFRKLSNYNELVTESYGYRIADNIWYVIRDSKNIISATATTTITSTTTLIRTTTSTTTAKLSSTTTPTRTTLARTTAATSTTTRTSTTLRSATPFDVETTVNTATGSRRPFMSVETTNKSLSIILLSSTTQKTTTGINSSNGHFKWYPWLIAATAITVVPLIIAVIIIGFIVYRWKKRNRDLGSQAHAKDDASPGMYPFKSFSPISFKSSFSSASTTPSSNVVKDPNLIAAQTNTVPARGYKGYVLRTEQNKPLDITRLTGAPSTASSKGGIFAKRKKAIPSIELKHSPKRASTKHGKTAALPPAVKVITIPNVKAMSAIRTKDNTQLHKGIQATKPTTGRYETVSPGKFVGSQNVRYPPVMKEIMAPARPPSGHTDVFWTLE